MHATVRIPPFRDNVHRIFIVELQLLSNCKLALKQRDAKTHHMYTV